VVPLTVGLGNESEDDLNQGVAHGTPSSGRGSVGSGTLYRGWRQQQRGELLYMVPFSEV
jgi:hypothetical protein